MIVIKIYHMNGPKDRFGQVQTVHHGPGSLPFGSRTSEQVPPVNPELQIHWPALHIPFDPQLIPEQIAFLKKKIILYNNKEA